MSESTENILQLNNVNFDIKRIVSTNYYSDAEGFLKFKNSPDYLANDINNSADAVGASIYIINSSYQIKHATNLFYLTDFSFALKERAQVTNSLKEPIIAFFDESVKVYSFQGAAPDAGSTDSFNKSRNFQHSSLVHLYNNHLRGTELAKNRNIAVLKIGNHTIYGYPLNLNSSFNSGQDKVATFNMNWAIAKHTLDLPGTVTNQDLESMTQVVSVNQQDIYALIDYLIKYIQNYYSVLNASDKYLAEVFELSTLTDLAQNIEALYLDLVNRNILINYEVVLLELSSSIDEVTSSQFAKSWLLYNTRALSAVQTLAQYLEDLQRGWGRVNNKYVADLKPQMKEQIDGLSELAGSINLDDISTFTKP